MIEKCQKWAHHSCELAEATLFLFIRMTSLRQWLQDGRWFAPYILYSTVAWEFRKSFCHLIGMDTYLRRAKTRPIRPCIGVKTASAARLIRQDGPMKLHKMLITATACMGAIAMYDIKSVAYKRVVIITDLVNRTRIHALHNCWGGVGL